jgi:HSP20 family protein
MAILRWGASKEMILLQKTMGKLFDEALAALSAKPGVSTLWLPSCDIYETAETIVLKVEAPGVEQDDLVLEVKENEVTLAGERMKKESMYAATYHRVERSGGRFLRKFTLPTNVKEDNVSASLGDGVLTVILPKKTPEKLPKVIQIEVE